MSVLIIIFGSLVTALLAIGVAGGSIMSIAAVFRLIAGKGRYKGKAVSGMKRTLMS